jgi:chemotaxis protein methyltransferase CheR
MLQRFKDLVRKKTQNILKDDKAKILMDKLRLQYVGYSLIELIEDLEQRGDLPHWLKSEATIHETFFFRHPSHFHVLENYARAFTHQELQAFCGGVSTGEEAYSLAICLQKVRPDIALKITGVDIDPVSIEVARQGVYGQGVVSRISPEYRDMVLSFLNEENTPHGKEFQVKDDLRSSVRFVLGNVFSTALLSYDIIFLRNILIYFAPEDRLRLIERAREKLKPGGLLFIGAGELFAKEFSQELLPNHTSILEKKGA